MKFIAYTSIYGHIARTENKFLVAVMPFEDQPPCISSVTHKIRKHATLSEDALLTGGVLLFESQEQATQVALAFEGVSTSEFYVKLYNDKGETIWTNI